MGYDALKAEIARLRAENARRRGESAETKAEPEVRRKKPYRADIADQAQQAIYAATENSRRETTPLAGSLLEETFDWLESDTAPGLPTGFTDVDRLPGGLRRHRTSRWTERALRLLERREHPRRKEGEQRRPQARDRALRNQHRHSQDVGIDLVQHGVLLRDAAPANHATNRYAVFRHPFEDDPGVQRRPFDRGEEFVLCRVIHVPAAGDAAKIRIDEDRAIAVVPGETQQPGLSGTMLGNP